MPPDQAGGLGHLRATGSSKPYRVRQQPTGHVARETAFESGDAERVHRERQETLDEAPVGGRIAPFDVPLRERIRKPATQRRCGERGPKATSARQLSPQIAAKTP